MHTATRSRARAFARSIFAIGLLAAGACADDKTPLLERINAYRNAPEGCGGKGSAAIAPLAPSSALSRVELASASASLPEALQRAGYAATRAQAIVLSGPPTSGAAMEMLRERYCETLLSTDFSEVGIAREGRTWRLVLAQPLISEGLGDWQRAGKEVLALVNEARSQSRTCGDRRFKPAPPLQWNGRLAAAALAHSRDMAARRYVAHTAPDGSNAGERASRAGYEWRRVGENIASGQGSPRQVVASWLASPVHCANIMEPQFGETGAAYAINRSSSTVIYWTQVFGSN